MNIKKLDVIMMGQEFLSIMDPDEVKKIIEDIPIKKRIEEIILEDSLGRVLAADVNSTINIPQFEKSLMDGYAVNAEDTYNASETNPVHLKLLEIVRAGDVPEKMLQEGCCTDVSTGAPIPSGSNSVVMVEFTERKDNEILIYESVAIGQNVVNEGSDITKGEQLLPAGTLITPDNIGVLCAIGIEKISVFKKPKIAVISTGNEIIQHDEKLTYGKIYDINSYTISSAVISCGCIPTNIEIVKDDYNVLKEKINELTTVDIIITSGGTSAGKGDVLSAVLEDIGEVLVHGISMKPGKPTIIGRIKTDKNYQYIIGLPGNPVAALMVFHVFFEQLLKEMASIQNFTNFEDKKTLQLKLSRRFHPARGRNTYVLVKIEGESAIPILKDSGSISSIAHANGFIRIPKNVEMVDKGTIVDVFPLGD